MPLFFLLHKSHNMLLIVLIGFQALAFVNFSISEEATSHPLKIVGRLSLLYWLGKASFFALGNSNSIATIDLSGAYAGKA